MALTLHQLRIFHAVARYGNLTRAAEHLGLSQPAVSIQIKQLERLLGLSLFKTVGRGQRLTEAGDVLDEHAVRVLAQLDELREAVDELRGIERGRLVVAADTTVGIYVMPQLLGTWHQEYSKVDVDLRVGNQGFVCQLLRNNEVDIAVVSNVPQIADLEVEEFLPNRLVIIAPPDHPLAQREGPLPADALSTQPFLVREDGSSTRSAMEAFCDQAGVELHIAMQLGSIGAIKQGVASGLGLGVVSERAIGNELAVGALVIVNVEGFPLALKWYIVHYRQKRLSPAAKSFKAFLRSAQAILAEPSLARAASAEVPRKLRREVPIRSMEQRA
ncbi:MAG TPA: LysR family transcriptional regulator [Chloroflexota bacterium]|nr:LysR family transcriptional regulator [Chloroflexota bacterium]